MPIKTCIMLPLLCLFLTASAQAMPAAASSDLSFSIQTGSIANHFFRRGAVAAHVSLRSGERPRILAAFPAGDAGIGLWFEDAPAPHSLQLQSSGEVHAVTEGKSRGVSFAVHADAAKISTKRLMLGGIRFLRAYEEGGPQPAELGGEIMLKDGQVFVHRTSFDGENSYQLRITPEPGTLLSIDKAHGSISIQNQAGRQGLGFELTALSSEEPLSPIPRQQLFKKLPSTPDELELADALAFLSYDEKILAGSWRFLTYFGRDSLLSIYLLRPVLGDPVVEAALAAVLERLSPEGHVAHEEDIGDWAAYRHLAKEPGLKGAATQPIYDYKMVDSDFLLATLAAAYFLDPASDPGRIQAFLQRKTGAGRTFKEALLSNLQLVLTEAAPYAAEPSFEHLIRLHPGEVVGDWRDSSTGLGGGVYPYSVNVAFVPAALHAVATLARSGVFADGTAMDLMARTAEQLAPAWAQTGHHFAVALDRDEASAALAAFQRNLGLGTPERAMPSEGRIFAALSLGSRGEPVPVMHSDEGFHLLFNEPPLSDLARAADLIHQTFPMGLLTPVGLVVANPAFTPGPPLWHEFTSNDYHGTVIWSWQQAVYLTGLRRQAARPGLPLELRANLLAAADKLATVIALAPSHGREELWTFHIDNGEYHAAPFGADLGDHSESNPIQLWSTVFYGLGERP